MYSVFIFCNLLKLKRPGASSNKKEGYFLNVFNDNNTSNHYFENRPVGPEVLPLTQNLCHLVTVHNYKRRLNGLELLESKQASRGYVVLIKGVRHITGLSLYWIY